MEIVHTTWIESPIGSFRIASTKQGLAYVELPHASGRGFDGWLRRRMPGARCLEGLAPNRIAAKQIVGYLQGERRDFDLQLDLRGTDFQLKVWDALLELEYGETCSYSDIAARVGRPNAVRAVGSANGANPVSLVVPCHRVIAADGTLGGYGGGLVLKRRLLAMEQGQRPHRDCLL